MQGVAVSVWNSADGKTAGEEIWVSLVVVRLDVPS